jgi:hypothetical protein
MRSLPYVDTTTIGANALMTFCECGGVMRRVTTYLPCVYCGKTTRYCETCGHYIVPFEPIVANTSKGGRGMPAFPTEAH